MGGYSATSDLDLGKKVGNLDFWDGGGILYFFAKYTLIIFPSKFT